MCRKHSRRSPAIRDEATRQTVTGRVCRGAGGRSPGQPRHTCAGVRREDKLEPGGRLEEVEFIRVRPERVEAHFSEALLRAASCLSVRCGHEKVSPVV